MRTPLLAAAACLLIPGVARADGITGTASSDVRAYQQRFVRASELRRVEETVKLDRTRTTADFTRDQQLRAIESRRLEERVRALEASSGAR